MHRNNAWTGSIVLAALLAGGTLLGGCAATPTDPESRAQAQAENDPIEPFNRYMMDLNLAADALFLKPAAQSYKDVVPENVRTGVHNALANLRAPLTFIHDLLQGSVDRADVTLARFLVNTIVGLGGIFDPATGLGLKHHAEDSGQTLAVWGADEGFYLVLPIFGPSNLRDAVGLAADIVIDPVSYYGRAENVTLLSMGRPIGEGIDARSRNIEVIDQLQKDSLDFYAAIRSAYRQRRVNEIRNGEPTGNVPAPSISGGASATVESRR
ncbi:MAG: VacJ family lipoprotein [Alphaproteobacteria bacterium]